MQQRGLNSSGLKRLWVVAGLLLCTATFHTNGAENTKRPDDSELLPPHHAGGDLPTPSVWGTQEVEAWLFAEGFGFLRKPFEDAQVNGRTLLAMRDHTLDVDFNLEPSEQRTASVVTNTAPVPVSAPHATGCTTSPQRSGIS